MHEGYPLLLFAVCRRLFPEMVHEGVDPHAFELNPTAERYFADAVCEVLGDVGHEHWMELEPAERVPLLQRAIRVLDGKAKPEADALTDNEHLILLALKDAGNIRLLVVDLAAKSKLSKRTIGRLLPKLAKRGLVDYDANARQGAAITDKGKAALQGVG